jgi:hypothetical protein
MTMNDDPKGSASEGAPTPQSTPPEPPTPPPFSPDLDLIGDLERGQRAANGDRTR